MIRRRDEVTTRQNLVLAAKKIFASHGINGATIKNISCAAKCNIALVSYYFGGKEELYRACLEDFGLHKLAFAERILTKPKSLEELSTRLYHFSEEFILSSLSEPEILEILNRECNSNNPIHQELFKNIFLKIFENVIHFFKDAKHSKILKKSADPIIIAQLFFGSLIHSLHVDRKMSQIFNKSLHDARYRREFLLHLIQQVTYGHREIVHV